jgi:Flp pilus assembly protein TadG
MKRFFDFVNSVRREKRGNVLMMTGFAIIPLVGATGMGIDYARAARIDTKLSAAADAAALAAVSQPMMKKTKDEAKAYATAIFNQQASQIPGLVYDPADLVITVSQAGSTADNRTVDISFSAKSKNSFGGILGLSTLNVGGKTQSYATLAANTDFYLVLDTSPSMALPTEQDGLDEMVKVVGCQFACHTDGARPHGIYVYDNNVSKLNKPMNAALSNGGTQIDSAGTYVKNGEVFNADDTYADSYWFAKNKNIKLRIDAERSGAAGLMDHARTKQQELINEGLPAPAYRAAIYTFDYKENFKTIANLSSNLEMVKSQASAIELLKVSAGGCGIPAPASNPSLCSNFLTTSYTGALTNANTKISAPGTGLAGSNPKKVMLMITDGVSDEKVGTINRTRSEMVAAHLAQCKTIKDRGITIAILYTQYTPESIKNNGSQGAALTARLTPVDEVAKALTACASPGLMYTVVTGQSIENALNALFDASAATARIVR